jgi:hypothetical protein
VGQRAAATGVKFRSGPSSALCEKVASGLVWRFGTFDCVSDNLACFKDGFGDMAPSSTSVATASTLPSPSQRR